MSCSADEPVYSITSADRELPDIQYEYLDHPADVQLHAWGDSLEVAFEQVTMAMFAYVTDISTISIESHFDVEVEGLGLLFHLLFLQLNLVTRSTSAVSQESSFEPFIMNRVGCKYRCK